jgi:hypothetical protein
MTETATEGTGTDTGTGTDGGTGTPDYEALYKAAAADVDKWKSLSRKHEKQAKDNADAGQTAAQRQAALDKVLAALGVEAAGSKTPDVDAITAQLQQAQASARAREVELAVLRVAGRSGADGDALLDSRSFLDLSGRCRPDRHHCDHRSRQGSGNRERTLRPRRRHGSPGREHRSAAGPGRAEAARPVRSASSTAPRAVTGSGPRPTSIAPPRHSWKRRLATTCWSPLLTN